MANQNLATCDQVVEKWLQQQVVCITGGRGALGRRLSQVLADRASRIVALDNQPATTLDRATRVNHVEHVVGDILNQVDLDRALQGCTVVFHLAALIHVGRSQTDPVRCFEVNGLGTARVLDACRRLGIRRVIYTSTSHVYGIPHQHPVTERHLTAPISVYASSKLAGEAVMHSYAASFGLSCDIVRLSNLYGASFGMETAIGRALGLVISGKPLALRNLDAVRDFIHADDVVDALLRLGPVSDSSDECRILNLSTGRGMSVREMVRTLIKVAEEQGLGIPEIIQTSSAQRESVPKMVLDNTLLRELTGWTPRIDLEQGLRLALKEVQKRGQEPEG